MAEYLKATDKNAFKGMKKRSAEPSMGLTAICAACKGYGGWHLQLDAYGIGKNFDCSCSTCNGWGYVKQKYAGHIHNYVFVKNTGLCLNLYKCDGCGDEWNVDSSD